MRSKELVLDLRTAANKTQIILVLLAVPEAAELIGKKFPAVNLSISETVEGVSLLEICFQEAALKQGF